MKLGIVGQYKAMANQYGGYGYCKAKNKDNYEG